MSITRQGLIIALVLLATGDTFGQGTDAKSGGSQTPRESTKPNAKAKSDGGASAQGKTQKNSAAKSLNAFQLAGLAAASNKTAEASAKLITEGKYAEAEKLLTEATANPAATAVDFYNLACTQALQNKSDAALANLQTAVEKGFRRAAHLKEDFDFISLRSDARFQSILRDVESRAAEQARPTPPRPQLVANGIALVGPENTVWDERQDLFLSAFRCAADDPRKKLPAASGAGKAGELLRQWQADKTAAGLVGILYDNHDRDHSNIAANEFPQLTMIEYCQDAKEISLDNAMQTRQLFNLPTFGNSSMAEFSQPYWRGLTRLTQVSEHSVGKQYLQYTYNHLYIYPEVSDYHPGRNGTKVGGTSGYGDVFPAHTPYVLTSQGASGSDKPFLSAVACTLAAFRPEIQKKLIQTKLLMPTVQMILRRSNKQTTSDEVYLTGQAHPPVFQGDQLDVERMVTMAHDMRVDRLPPMIQLQVIDEDLPRQGVDFFDALSSERLFDTPAAIARVHRTVARERRMVVSASKSFDVNGKPLRFHWVLLQGVSDQVQIMPRKDDPSTVELRIRWHDRFPIAKDSPMESNRVDIGAFAHNGDYYSAPGIVSVYFPDSEARRYRSDGQIESVDYRSQSSGGNYVDPLVYTSRDWRDEYHYDGEGRLAGWTRVRGGAKEEFTANGELILEQDATGKPLKTSAVMYRAKRDQADRPHVLEQIPASPSSTAN